METNLAVEGRDFSLIGLILHADPFVQAIMLLLAVASVICWALIFEKFIRILALKRQVRQLAQQAANGHLSPDRGRGIVGAVQQAAQSEWSDGVARGETRNEVRGRLERAMRSAMKSQLRRIETGLPFLATVGSASPFVGLLGTVWGIMHSFTAIAQAKDTSLAVVAPGIAEALFATALGLAAAIPAVIAYNQISVSLGKASERAGSSITSLAKSMAKIQSDGVVRLEGVG